MKNGGCDQPPTTTFHTPAATATATPSAAAAASVGGGVVTTVLGDPGVAAAAVGHPGRHVGGFRQTRRDGGGDGHLAGGRRRFGPRSERPLSSYNLDIQVLINLNIQVSRSCQKPSFRAALFFCRMRSAWVAMASGAVLAPRAALVVTDLGIRSGGVGESGCGTTGG